MDSTHPRISARQADALLALGLSAALVLELSLGSNIAGPFWANYVCGLVVTVAVAWRRPWPVWALAAQMIAILVSTIGNGDLTENPISPFLAVIVVMYGVGSYAPVGWSRFGVGIGLLGIVLIDLAGNSNDDVGSYVGTALLAIVLPWAAGRAAKEWAQRALELERVNAALKAEQEQRSLLAVADERSRIARELHDVVAHSISVMVVQAEGAKRMMDHDPRRAKSALEQIEGTGRAALVEMRRLLGVLRKEKDAEGGVRTPQPGTQTLDMLVNRAQEAGLDVRVANEGKKKTLPAGVDVSVFRIIQEALTNSLKHAGPTRADVLLTYTEDNVEVEIVDAGIVNGFSPPTSDPDNPQHGLLGMKERVSLYGGEIVTGPCEDGRDGYRVWARIPLTSS
jgi:signal transduction histidine kinase